MKQPFKGDRYKPVTWRRRLTIVLLAVVTACGLLLYMLGRRGDIWRSYPHSALVAVPEVKADAPRCRDGNTVDCVGGMATVIVAPAPAASTPPARHRPAPG